MKKLAILALLAAVITAALSVQISGSEFTVYLETFGEAVSLENNRLYITGIGLTDGSPDDVLLDLQNAEIFNLQSGFMVPEEYILPGDAIRAVYMGDEGTGYEAVTVYLHAGEPDSADLRVMVSDNIRFFDDGCAFATPDGKYRVTLTEDSLILDPYGNEIAFFEIEPGMDMFIWASSITASFPGHVFPDRIVLVG